MNELALFAGAGGGILGGQLLGWRTVCAVERDAYAAGILAQRQNDGYLAPFPIWSDIETFDGTKWRGIVEVISGGFPCQDISCAGKGAGITGERSGLWREMFRVVREVRPRFVFVENSPILTSRGLGVVLGDLASAGYDCRWLCLSAAQVGAPHQRDRIWILAANTHKQSRVTQQKCQHEGAKEFSRGGSGQMESFVTDTVSTHVKRDQCAKRKQKKYPYACESRWWETEPAVDRMVDGLAYRVDRLKALGNGQVPSVAKKAWSILIQSFDA